MKFLCCNIYKDMVEEPKNVEEELKDIYQMLNVKSEDIKYFTFEGKVFYAKHCNIYDGDTFSVIFNYKGDLIKYKVRCIGYDSPEMKPLKTNEHRILEKELALKSKLRLEELLNKHETKLIKIECFQFDKYGRLLVKVWNMIDKKSVNEIMIEEGHGKAYDGGTKEKW